MAQEQAAVINDTITAALAALGDTPDRVAATLRAGGCRGQRGNGQACPVHAYLQARIPQDVIFGVGQEHVDVDLPDQSRRQIALPNPVVRFVFDFDAGAYPDLDMP